MVLYAINGRDAETERLYSKLHDQFGDRIEKFFAHQGEILTNLNLPKGAEIVYRTLNKFHPRNPHYRKTLKQALQE